MKMFNYTSAIVLGMHDALVSVLGTIAGITFALSNNNLIILTATIASLTASFSMGASNYLAEKTNKNPYALRAGIYTGLSYCATSVLLILPFAIFSNQYIAMISSFIIAILIIFGFNFCAYRLQGKPFIKQFLEMFIVCFIVSVVAFAIGITAKIFLGIDI